MKKRGISAIVATVLTILITVAGVAIVWVGVLPIVNDALGDVNTDVRLSIISSEGYTVWDPDAKLVTVQVERKGEGEACGLDLIFVMGGDSVSHYVDGIPGENARKVYYINLSDYHGGLSKISVAPVFCDGSVGDVISSLEFGDIPEANIAELIEDGVLEEKKFEDPNGGSSSPGIGPVVGDCVDDSGCSGEDGFCDAGDVPYSCSFGSDGCLDRVNGTACGDGESCVAGICVESEPVCGEDIDCYYLDASATGANNGSDWANAWQTIEDAQAGTAALGGCSGCTVLIEEGNYIGQYYEWSSSPERTDYLTFKSRDGAKVKWIRKDNDLVVVNLGSTRNHYLRFENIEIQGNFITTSNPDHMASYIQIVNCTIGGIHEDDSRYEYAGTDLSSYPAGAPLVIRGGTDILVEDCEILEGSLGLYIRDAENVIVRNNEIHGMSKRASGVKNSKNVIVENNHVYDCRARELGVETAWDDYIFIAGDPNISVDDDIGLHHMEINIQDSFTIGVVAYFNFDEPRDFIKPTLLEDFSAKLQSSVPIAENELFIRVSENINGVTSENSIDIALNSLNGGSGYYDWNRTTYDIDESNGLSVVYPEIMNLGDVKSIAIILAADKEEFTLKFGERTNPGIKFADGHHSVLFVMSGDNYVFRNNTLHGGGAMGLFTMGYQTFSNTLLENNLMYDIDGSQFTRMYFGKNVTFRSNTIVGKLNSDESVSWGDNSYYDGATTFFIDSLDYYFGESKDFIIPGKPVEAGSLKIYNGTTTNEDNLIAIDDSVGNLVLVGGIHGYTDITGTIDYSSGEVSITSIVPDELINGRILYDIENNGETLVIENNIFVGHLSNMGLPENNNKNIVYGGGEIGQDTLTMNSEENMNGEKYMFNDSFFVNAIFKPRHGLFPGEIDFHPLMDSPACDGSVNGQEGIAVGALECV